MMLLTQQYAKSTLALKLMHGLQYVMHALQKWFDQEIEAAQPNGFHFSRREWNRNSAFIMSQYELSHDINAAGSIDE